MNENLMIALEAEELLPGCWYETHPQAHASLSDKPLIGRKAAEAARQTYLLTPSFGDDRHPLTRYQLVGIRARRGPRTLKTLLAAVEGEIGSGLTPLHRSYHFSQVRAFLELERIKQELPGVNIVLGILDPEVGNSGFYHL